MRFSMCSALWAFITLSSASPISNDAIAARHMVPAARGIFWTPRSLQTRDGRDNRRGNNRDRNNIIVVQPINVQLTQVQIVQEVTIINVIQNLIVIEGLSDARDNVRRNHYKNRNRGRQVNTVIIVVVVVVDARDRNQQNLRYLTRQIESNPEAQTKEWVVVTESSTLTVGDQNPTAGVGATGIEAPAALPTGAVAPPVGVYDPNAELQLGDDALLPAGIAAPEYESKGASREQDPAIILEADQAVFVVFDDNNNDNDNDDNGNGNGKGNKDERDDKKRD